MSCGHLLAPMCGCALANPRAIDGTELAIAGIVPDDPDAEAEDARAADWDEFDPDEIEEELRLGDVEACRRSFPEFVRMAWAALRPGEELEWGEHLDAICLHVQWQLEDREACRRDRNRSLVAQNLLINCPPRCLKSFILAVATVWCWWRWPRTKIMYLSANPRVALNSARIARDLMVGPWFQRTFRPKWQLRGDQDALSDMGNDKGGIRLARGLDSTITGEGCDWLIIDDPHDMKHSDSQVAAAILNYDSAVANRINDPRVSIRTGIMQRHPNPSDFTGHVLEQMLGGGVRWLHLRIPMEFERRCDCKCGTCSEDFNLFGWRDWRTEEGQVMHARFTRTFLTQEMIRLNSFGYAAQMQQRPEPKGGGKIKAWYFGFYRLEGDDGHALAGDAPRPDGCVGSRQWIADHPNTPVPPVLVVKRRTGPGSHLFTGARRWEFDWCATSVDAANKNTTRGSQWGVLTAGGAGPRVFLLDDVTRRGDLPSFCGEGGKGTLCDQVRKWEPRKMYVEDKAAGPSAMDTLRAQIQSGAIKRESDGKPIACAIEEVSPGSEDKDMRMDAVLGKIEACLVYLPEGAPWVADFIREITRWPATPNDRGDALSQLLISQRVGTSYADLIKEIGQRARSSTDDRTTRAKVGSPS